MIPHIAQLCALFSISVYVISASEHQLHAISSQSYHREDVPLSYKFTAVHNSIRPWKNANDYSPYHHITKKNYHPIQYAPLEENTQDYASIKNRYDYKKSIYKISPSPSSHQYHTSEVNARPSPIEPKFVTEHGSSYHPYIDGHDAVAVPFKKHHLDKDSFKPENYLPVRSTNIYTYPKPSPPNGIQNLVSPVVSQKQYAFGFLPNVPEKTLHEQLAFEKSQKLYQHGPRLHLNIARGFNIAKLQPKALDGPAPARYPRLSTYVPNTNDLNKSQLYHSISSN